VAARGWSTTGGCQPCMHMQQLHGTLRHRKHEAAALNLDESLYLQAHVWQARDASVLHSCCIATGTATRYHT
jgi:hypothetical protein